MVDVVAQQNPPEGALVVVENHLRDHAVLLNPIRDDEGEMAWGAWQDAVAAAEAWGMEGED